MQSGRNISQEDRVLNRGSAKVSRNMEKKQPGRVILPDTRTPKKPPPSAVNKLRPRATTSAKTDENRVSYSIQKLLSVYETSKEDKKTRIIAKPSGNNLTTGYQKLPKKPAVRSKKPEEVKRKSKIPPENDKIQQCDQFTTLQTPSQSPVKFIDSFIANCLDEQSDGRFFGSDYLSDQSDFIIMLGRRNCEPYSKSCILRYRQANQLLDPVNGYCCLENRVQPYWQVSVIRSNRSLAILPPAQPILQNGNFGPRQLQLPGVSSKDKERTWEKVGAPISKDDNYKPPAHLLVYAKSSQKKLLASGNRPDNSVNKKVHKMKKTTETKNIFWKKVFFVSAALLVTGGILLVAYLLAKRPNFFNLTPPIPGLVRGC